MGSLKAKNKNKKNKILGVGNFFLHRQLQRFQRSRRIMPDGETDKKRKLEDAVAQDQPSKDDSSSSVSYFATRFQELLLTALGLRRRRTCQRRF